MWVFEGGFGLDIEGREGEDGRAVGDVISTSFPFSFPSSIPKKLKSGT